MSKHLFRKQVIESSENSFTGDILLLPQVAHSLATGILIFWIVVAILAMSLVHTTKVETVSGWLEPSGGVVKVFPKDDFGIIDEVYVSNGQRVDAEQPLVRISGEKSLPNGTELQKELESNYNNLLKSLRNNKRRNENLYALKTSNLNRNLRSRENDSSKLKEQIDVSYERLRIMEERLNSFRNGVDDSFIAKADFLILKESVLKLKQDTISLEREREQVLNSIFNIKDQMTMLPLELQSLNHDIDSKITDTKSILTELRGESGYLIKSPVAGIVSNLSDTTGVNVNMNSPLLTIESSSPDFLFKILVPLKSAGLIQPGQFVNIKYDAYL